MAKKSFARSFCSVLQSVVVAAALYGLLYLGVLVIQRGSIPNPKDLYHSTPTHSGSASDNVGQGIKLPSPKLKVEKINPSANWFNRPESLVVPKDDYLGKRPNVDTIANLTKLVEECRGSYENIEKMPYVHDCLKYMDEGEKEYFYTPPRGERASEQPQVAQSTSILTEQTTPSTSTHHTNLPRRNRRDNAMALLCHTTFTGQDLLHGESSCSSRVISTHRTFLAYNCGSGLMAIETRRLWTRC